MANLREFTCGGAGGLSLLLAGHPFDTIKVRTQTKPEIYRNFLQATKLTVVQEGPLAVYKGVTPLIPSIAPYMSLAFVGFEHGKQLVSNNKKQEKYLSINQLAIAGFISGIYTTPLIGPAERIKCLAQVEQKKSFQLAKEIYQAKGIKSFYKGGTFTALRECIGAAFYFGTYHYLKQNYLKNLEKEESKNGNKTNNNMNFPVFYNLLYGGLAGVSMWCIVVPFDVIKSRIQTAPEHVTTKETLKIIRADVNKNGTKVLYRGLSAALIRSFPANAACFLGYEKARVLFDYYMDV